MNASRSPRNGPLPSLLWEDGMFLLPHHFQYQEERLERLILEHATGNRFGVTRILIDEEALRQQNVYRIRSGEAFFEDGQKVHIPLTADPPPEGLEILPERAKAEGGILVLLGIPEIKPRGGNAADGSRKNSRDGLFRYRIDSREVPDDNAENTPAEVISTRHVVTRIFIEGDDTAGYLTMPIDRVILDEDALKNDGREELKPDPEFLPPASHAVRNGPIWARFHQAANRLEAVLVRQAKLLDSRLISRRSFDQDEIRELMKIQHLSRDLADLRYDLHEEEVPVKVLVKSTLRIIAGLAPFADRVTRFLPTLSDNERHPPYDPTTPHTCIDPLMGLMREVVAQVFPADHPSYPFVLDNKTYIWKVGVEPEWVLDGRYKLYLRIVTDDTPGIVPDMLQQQINVGSPQTVQKMQGRAVSALNLVKIGPVLPHGLPQGPRFHYFLIERTNKFWDAVVRERELAARVLGRVRLHFQSLSLWVVEPDKREKTDKKEMEAENA